MKKYVILGAAFVLAACGTSQQPTYFSLAAEDGTPAPDIDAAIKIQRPVLPGYLDRPDFVYQDGAYRLSIDESANWAEPLDKMFARILAADLQQRLPRSVVWTGDDNLATPRFVVSVTADRFNPVGNGAVALQGNLVITDRVTGLQTQSTPFALTDAMSGSARSVAAGLSHLIASEADAIVENIASLNARVIQTAPQ